MGLAGDLRDLGRDYEKAEATRVRVSEEWSNGAAATQLLHDAADHHQQAVARNVVEQLYVNVEGA